ncbi:hypothetical protein LINPERPRIM_LOCUS24596 [Linum perenne]
MERIILAMSTTGDHQSQLMPKLGVETDSSGWIPFPQIQTWLLEL